MSDYRTPAQLNLARTRTVELAYICATGRASSGLAREAGAPVDAGLVSVSTSHTDRFLDIPEGVPVPIWFAENVITIDRQMARVTRLRKGVGVAAKALHNAAGHRAQKIMSTLTYRGDNRDWSAKDISAYIKCVKSWYHRLTQKKLPYVWVAELQGRGVIHYHCVFWIDRGVTMPKADKRGWWPHGMTKTEVARKPIGYLMSYLSKIESKNFMEFPHGARIYGIGGLDKSGADCKRWVLWPSYVQGNAAAGDPFKPAKGGGYINHETGEYFSSEFAPTGGGYRSYVRVRTHQRRMDASGPFSWYRTSSTLQ